MQLGRLHVRQLPLPKRRQARQLRLAQRAAALTAALVLWRKLLLRLEPSLAAGRWLSRLLLVAVQQQQQHCLMEAAAAT